MPAQLNTANPPGPCPPAVRLDRARYTAAGALAGFAMIFAVFNGDYRLAFLLMVGATVIDASDGVLARLARGQATTPNFDGARLDDIVDYLTFVFVPAAAAVSGRPAASRVGRRRCRGDAAEQRVRIRRAPTPRPMIASLPDFRPTGTSWRISLRGALAPGAQRGHSARTERARLRQDRLRVPDADAGPARPDDCSLPVWGVMVLAMILTLPDAPSLMARVARVFPIYYTVLSLVLNARRGRRS